MTAKTGDLGYNPYWISSQYIEDLRPDSIYTSNFVFDYEGNAYGTIKIGNQVWMAENLSTTHGADGSVLNDVYTYNDDENNVAEYGRLYNQQSALEAQIPGWHLPSDAQWDILINFVGSNPVNKLLIGGSTGFEAKFGGLRLDGGGYDYIGVLGTYWTSNQVDPIHGTVKLLADGLNNVITNNTNLNGGKSVRFIKD